MIAHDICHRSASFAIRAGELRLALTTLEMCSPCGALSSPRTFDRVVELRGKILSLKG